MSRRVVAVLVDRANRTGYASVDPDLAGAAGLGAYDATMTLLRAAAGRSRSLLGPVQDGQDAATDEGAA